MSTRTAITKRRLYDAAIELIGERGYDNTSVDDIVEAAGMAKGTVYYHFTGKAELFESLIRERMGSLVERFREIEVAHSDDPQAAIAELVRVLLEFLSAETAYSRLMVTELWRTDRPWYPTLLHMRTELVNTMCRVVKSGIEKNVFRSDIDPDFGGYALFGMTTFCMLDASTHEPHRTYEDLLEQILSATWAALRVC